VSSGVLSELMQAFVIEGGQRLSGTIKAAGNKNGVLPILAATLLAQEPVTLSNVPRIRDVDTMLDLLAERFEVVTAPGQSTLVAFRPDGDPEETVGHLAERGVVARDIPGSGLVRVSVGYWTSDDDLRRLMEGLAA
jgi:5-enolpyruvylshikimate-3-phosphate synthase